MLLGGDLAAQTEEAKVQASDKQAGDRFGISVSISGDRAIVGAQGEDTGGPLAGAAYIKGTSLGAPEVALRHDLLSVQAIDVPLAELLRAIGAEASFEVIIKGDLSAPVTWSFTDAPVDKALRRLLRNANSVLIHAPARDGGAGLLVELRVWPGHGDAAASAASCTTTARACRRTTPRR